MTKGTAASTDELAVVAEATKACTKCSQEKSLEQFSKQKNGTHDGLRYYCKACCSNIENKRRATFDAKHKQELRERSKACIQKDRDRIGNTYMRRLLQARGMGSFANISAALVELQHQRIFNMRLARELKKAANESSKNIDRIPGQHERSGDARRLAQDRCEQPAGVGS